MTEAFIMSYVLCLFNRFSKSYLSIMDFIFDCTVLNTVDSLYLWSILLLIGLML